MKKILLSTAALLALVLPASAADLGARPYTKGGAMVSPIYDWSGFYVGANGGFGSSRNCWDLIAVPAGALAAPLAQGCNTATGGTAGGQIGFRAQSGGFVYGLEGQGNWADLNGSNPNLVFPALTNHTRIDAFGLITGQLGFAWNNVLGYVKGGAAVVNDRHRSFVTATGALVDSASASRWGATVGAGLEVGISSNWSVGVEYNHLFLGSHDLVALTPAGGVSVTDRVRQDVDLGLVRVNYRWGGPIISKY